MIMKKQLLLVVAFAITTFSAYAQLPYASGKVATNADFALPSFWGGNSTVYLKSGLATGSYKEGFAEAIGIAADATEANAIRMAKTENDGYAELTLPSCGNITLICWGTGGRGMEIRKGAKDGELLGWAGDNSYTAITVSADVNSVTPVTIFLLPTGKESGSASTGDTYIAEINITAGESSNVNAMEADNKVIATEYYNVAGIQTSQAQEGLNIVKNIYEDGSVTINKVYVK